MSQGRDQLRGAVGGTRTALRTLIRLGLFFIIGLAMVWGIYAAFVWAGDTSVSAGTRGLAAAGAACLALCCLLMLVVAADATVLGGAIAARLPLGVLHVAVWVTGAGAVGFGFAADNNIGTAMALVLLPAAIAFLLLTATAKSFLATRSDDGGGRRPKAAARQRKGGRKHSR